MPELNFGGPKEATGIKLCSIELTSNTVKNNSLMCEDTKVFSSTMNHRIYYAPRCRYYYKRIILEMVLQCLAFVRCTVSLFFLTCFCENSLETIFLAAALINKLFIARKCLGQRLNIILS